MLTTETAPSVLGYVQSLLFQFFWNCVTLLVWTDFTKARCFKYIKYQLTKMPIWKDVADGVHSVTLYFKTQGAGG